MLSFLNSLPIPVIRILDIEANRFYDRNHQMYEAALLTGCHTQHALHPFIDAEINHQRHFIKIPFIDKGAFSRAIFLWQRSIVTETMAKYLRSHTATKSLKENLSKNLC